MSRNGLVARCDRNAIRCDTSSDPGPGGASGRVLKKEINRRVITQHPSADFRVRSPPPDPDRERRGEQRLVPSRLRKERHRGSSGSSGEAVAQTASWS